MFNKKFNLLKEATEYGFMPYMETYILDGKKRPIVVIFPGGGYGMVSEREAERIAMAYNAAGFHAAVVYYCVEPHTHPLPIQNAANAVAMLRENAEKWNIDTDNESNHLWSSLSLERRITDIIPPTFLWHTYEDICVPVENTLMYAAGLRRVGVPFELHIFEKGEHGLSRVSDELIWSKRKFEREYPWLSLSVDWLNQLF